MTWKRLESAAVDPSLAQGLEARVADPTWFLARQWQSGEFRGDDAANPLMINMTAASTPIERLRPRRGQAIPVGDRTMPLEPMVERENVYGGPAGQRWAVDLGRLLIRALTRAGAPTSFIDEVKGDGPVRPFGDELDPVGARRANLAAATAVNGRTILSKLQREPNHYRTAIEELAVSALRREKIAKAMGSWYEEAINAMGGDGRRNFWDHERMEYSFSLEAGDAKGAKVTLSTAEGYTGGRLDWFSFNRSRRGGRMTASSVVNRSATVLPAPLRFRGMPAARFWEFEAGDVYLGGIEAGPQDLARVAVAGYGVVYGDDWFVVPLRLPYGTLTEITKLTVIDDFSTAPIDIRSAAEVDGDTNGRAFKFFELTGDLNPRNNRSPLLFLAPTVKTTDASQPVEDVAFLRDEAANLAWAVEQRIESPAGRAIDLNGRSGRAGAEQFDPDRWAYVLSSPVPDNWVPLVPVRITETDEEDPDRAAVMFQRGRLPNDGDEGGTRGARGDILRPWERLLIHEEEVPRTGMEVLRRYQSARDAAGRLHIWAGRQKRAGRGQGESGLTHDRLDTGLNEHR